MTLGLNLSASSRVVSPEKQSRRPETKQAVHREPVESAGKHRWPQRPQVLKLGVRGHPLVPLGKRRQAEG